MKPLSRATRDYPRAFLGAFESDYLGVTIWGNGHDLVVGPEAPGPVASQLRSLHRLPSYGPELNPDEFVWPQAKLELSNLDHAGLVPLTLQVVRSLQRIGRSQVLLRSCSTRRVLRSHDPLGRF